MAALCAQYLSRCQQEGRRPTWQGLAGQLDVTSTTLTGWLQEEGAHSEVLRKAADAISDALQQRTDSMAVLSVKQTLYGGFLDKAQGPGGDTGMRIVVTVGPPKSRQTREYGR